VKNLILLSIFAIITCGLFAQSVAGFQEYYIPGPEDNLDTIWSYVEGTYSTFRTVVSVTATTDNTEITYDHWEDGYSFSDASNEPPILSAGEYNKFEDSDIGIDNDDDSGDGNQDPEFTSGNSTTYNYDGGDRIYVAGGPVFVLRAALPNPVMSICLELLPTEAWRGGSGGIDFIIPFGTDLFASNGTVFHDFESVAVVIQSASDANTITVDCPDNVNDWSGDIDKGETKYLIDVRQGTTISTDAIAQVHMIIGHDADGASDGARELRGLSGIPAYDGAANDYWAPIEVTGNTDIFIYNHNAGSITVSYEDGTTGSFSVSAGETVSYQNKTGHYASSGAHIWTANNDEFCAVMSVDTRSATRDWATVLTQSSLLGTDYRIGWAAGDSSVPSTTICNSIFAIATENDTDIFVDFDADGIVDQSFIGGNTLDKFDVVLIADESDHDTSGARIWTNDKIIALSYGEIAGDNPFEGGTTPSGGPAMDLGYTILPMPEAWVDPVIEVTASNDQGSTPLAVAGENVVFTIRLDAHDYALTGVDLHSVLDLGWEYATGTTNITHYVNDSPDWTSTTDPNITGSSDPGYHLEWDTNRSVASDDYIILTFQAHPTSSTNEGENEIQTETVGRYESFEFNAYDSEFVTVDGEEGVFGDEPVPVCLSSFMIVMEQGSPLISWTTQSEMSSLGWNIYRNTEEDQEGSVKINESLIEGAGYSTTPIDYEYADAGDLENGSTYWYFLENVNYNSSSEIVISGSIQVTGIEDDIPVYEDQLHGNHPNPFNPSTNISFSIKNTSQVKLTIFNTKGQIVTELLNATLEAGEYSREWNGKDMFGNNITSGLYFTRLNIGKRSITKKMLMIK